MLFRIVAYLSVSARTFSFLFPIHLWRLHPYPYHIRVPTLFHQFISSGASSSFTWGIHACRVYVHLSLLTSHRSVRQSVPLSLPLFLQLFLLIVSILHPPYSFPFPSQFLACLPSLCFIIVYQPCRAYRLTDHIPFFFLCFAVLFFVIHQNSIRRIFPSYPRNLIRLSSKHDIVKHALQSFEVLAYHFRNVRL